MKIVAKVRGEHLTLVNKLKSEGIVAKLVKNATIVEPVKNESHTCLHLYHLPTALQHYEYTLVIDIAEEGGGATNTGHAIIVCGLSGKKLKPYYIPKGYSNQVHAYFSVPGGVVTVEGCRADNAVTIVKHDIKMDGKLASIVSTEIWTGEKDALPNLYAQYKHAVIAAHEKANCYHCRHVHYAV